MSRNYYSEDYEENAMHFLWPAIIARSINGKRGQKFLNALATAMDEMPEKRLIAGRLITPEGECCTMGVICKARNIDVSDIHYNDPEEAAKLLNISPTMAFEIVFQNDDYFDYNPHIGKTQETPDERWIRMRAWVDSKIRKDKV
jgi:hypothetical protein